MVETSVRNGVISLVVGDITDMDVEAFVFYAREDLQLGSGFGNAIAVRGGPGIQRSLNEVGGLEPGAALVGDAGNLKARHIVHVVGPRFQETDIEEKLRSAIRAALSAAERKGIREIAFPPMGAGFYGVPLDVSARITVDEIARYLGGETGIRSVVICANDMREFRPLRAVLERTG